MLMWLMNLGFAGSGASFNPAWAHQSNQLVGPIAPQPETK